VLESKIQFKIMLILTTLFLPNEVWELNLT